MATKQIIRKESKHTYLHLAYCLKLYKVCNKVLFKWMDDLDFMNLMNLRNTVEPVVVVPGKNGYVYYLIYIISEELLLKEWLSEEWIEGILKRCNLKKESYESHYTDVKNSNDGDKKEFREMIAEAIKEAETSKEYYE